MSNLYTYPYDSAYVPPMPVVDITITSPGQQQISATITALVDSGADATLIPINVLEQVGARYVDKARIWGILGHSQAVDVYLVTLQIGPNQIYSVRAIAVEVGATAILGRNALNHIVVTLNGLANTTELLA